MARTPMSRRVAVVLVCAAAVGAGLGTDMLARAQIPQKFTNLKIFPKDVTRPVLIGEMREITGALGVRCNYCHVGGDPETLQGVDFAADSLESKRVARVMMRMTREINGVLLPQTGRDTTRLARVSCVTCHHGARRPETLSDTLLRALDTGGTAGTMASYRALRDQFHGRAVYDFGEATLIQVSELAARRPDRAGASIPLLELNLEFFPKSVNTLFALGEQLVAMGDTAAAVKRWEEVLDLQPDNRWAKRRLDAARGRPASGFNERNTKH